jgi:HK97 family phage major capsid protein
MLRVNKEQYLAKRKELLAQAQKFLDAGKTEDANAKMKEIETLDNEYEVAAKAEANLNALKDNVKITNLEDKSKNIDGQVIDTMVKENTDKADIYNSLEYRRAFMNNVLKGIPIPDKFVNADANTKTSDVGSVIPTTILEKIIEKMDSTGNQDGISGRALYSHFNG